TLASPRKISVTCSPYPSIARLRTNAPTGYALEQYGRPETAGTSRTAYRRGFRHGLGHVQDICACGGECGRDIDEQAGLRVVLAGGRRRRHSAALQGTGSGHVGAEAARG